MKIRICTRFTQSAKNKLQLQLINKIINTNYFSTLVILNFIVASSSNNQISFMQWFLITLTLCIKIFLKLLMKFTKLQESISKWRHKINSFHGQKLLSDSLLNLKNTKSSLIYCNPTILSFMNTSLKLTCQHTQSFVLRISKSTEKCLT